MLKNANEASFARTLSRAFQLLNVATQKEDKKNVNKRFHDVKMFNYL